MGRGLHRPRRNLRRWDMSRPARAGNAAGREEDRQPVDRFPTRGRERANAQLKDWRILAHDFRGDPRQLTIVVKAVQALQYLIRPVRP